MLCLIITPRNHPNLLHLVSSLRFAGYQVCLMVEYVTFESATLGEEANITLTSHVDATTWLASKKPDLVIQRHYPKKWTQAVRDYSRNTGATWIQYDQRPLRSGLTGLVLETLFLLHRVLMQRPHRRITPVFEHGLIVSRSAATPFHYPLRFPRRKISSTKENAGFHRIATVGKLWQKRKKLGLLVRCLSELDYRGHLDVISVSRDRSKVQTKEQLSKEESLLENLRLRYGGKFSMEIHIDKSHNDTLEIIQKSDFFCLPSVREPFAISPLEAMSLGKPVVITSSNGARTYVNNGVTGYVVPPYSRGAFRRAIQKLLSDSALVHQIGVTAKRTIAERNTERSFLDAVKKRELKG